MKLVDIFRYAYYALKERKVRTTLTILGIIIGPAAVVALTATTQGFSHQIEGQLLKLGTNTILISPASGTKLGLRHIEEISYLEQVKEVYPYYIIPGRIPTTKGEEAVTVFAIDLARGLPEAVPGIEVDEGYLPDPFDYVGAALGHYIAHPQDPQKQPYSVDDVVTVKFFTSAYPSGYSKSFIVRAILNEFGPTFFVNPDSAIFVPLDVGRSITGSSTYNGLMVISKSADYVDQIVDEIKDMYGDDVNVFSVKVAVNIARNVLSSINMILVSVASISVLVAFIGIMTTMFTSTVERTREIGLLKALGFSRKDLLALFLSESTLMGMIGGLGGSVSGVILAYILSYMFTFSPIRGTRPGPATAVIQAQPVFTPEMILLAFLLATLVGAIAGLIPAWRASRLVPVEALRYE